MNTEQIVNQLNSTINGFATKVNVEVNHVDSLTQQVKATADKAYSEIKNFKQSMIENEQMQIAHENVLRINQIIRERFSDYDSIRKTAIGIIRDCDINLVRGTTIQELSEQLWITSSRYWLAYTLICISAWVNDNQGICKNALSESYRVDKVKTSLFFCLMNLRFNRLDVAKEWLVEYFTTVIPEDIQNETAIIIQAYINGVFGVDKDLELTVKDVVDQWIDAINLDDEANEELTKAFGNYIKNLAPTKRFKRDFINKYCVNRNQLDYSYLEASKYDTLIAAIKKVDVDNIVQNAANFKQRVDAILVDLVTNYDAEELELKTQQEYYELIIQNKGKEDVAETQFNEMMAQRNKKQNIGQKCVEWALYNDKQIDIHVKKFAYQNTKVWYLAALNEWSTNFERQFPEEYQIEIEDWSSVSNGEDAFEQEASLKEHLEKNKFKIKYVNKPNFIWLALAILGLVGIFVFPDINPDPIFLGMTLGPIVGLGLFLVSAIVLLVRVLTANSRFNKKVKALLGLLNGTMVEIAEYRKTYFENKDKKATLYSLIEHL